MQHHVYDGMRVRIAHFLGLFFWKLAWAACETATKCLLHVHNTATAHLLLFVSRALAAAVKSLATDHS